MVAPSSMTVQQLVPDAHSAGVVQSGTVSVAVQLRWMSDGQAAFVVQTLSSDPAMQWGSVPPLRTMVAQQVGVAPLQSDGFSQ
jgi:hypothetical protein